MVLILIYSSSLSNRDSTPFLTSIYSCYLVRTYKTFRICTQLLSSKSQKLIFYMLFLYADHVSDFLELWVSSQLHHLQTCNNLQDIYHNSILFPKFQRNLHIKCPKLCPATLLKANLEQLWHHLYEKRTCLLLAYSLYLNIYQVSDFQPAFLSNTKLPFLLNLCPP